jgi:hypothetical protein
MSPPRVAPTHNARLSAAGGRASVARHSIAAAAHDAAQAAGQLLPEMMQPKQLGVMEIFQLYGSVLPRCFLHALFSAVLGGVLEYFEVDLLSYRVVWQHPYALQLFSMVLGFSLVMRIQIAYARYWEGATQCFQASSKWIDAAMQMVAFDEASKDAFSDKGFEFRFAMLHYMSLMHAVAMIDMRQDDELGVELALNRRDPYTFSPNQDTKLLESGLRGVPDAVEEEAGGDDDDDDEGAASMPAVPLQGVLRARKQLEACSRVRDINSWAALDAEEAGKPLNYELTRADRDRSGERGKEDCPKPIRSRGQGKESRGSIVGMGSALASGGASNPRPMCPVRLPAAPRASPAPPRVLLATRTFCAPSASCKKSGSFAQSQSRTARQPGSGSRRKVTSGSRARSCCCGRRRRRSCSRSSSSPNSTWWAASRTPRRRTWRASSRRTASYACRCGSTG